MNSAADPSPVMSAEDTPLRVFAFFAQKMARCTGERGDNERSHRDADTLIVDILTVLAATLHDEADRADLVQITSQYREAAESRWWFG